MKKQLTILIVLFFSACTSTKFTVINVRETNELSKDALLYALPRTIIDVAVEITKETFIAGPYSVYAEKYLGYKNVSQRNSEKWKINGIELIGYPEPDPNHLYWLQASKNSPAVRLNLWSNNIIAGINTTADIAPIILPETNLNFAEIPTNNQIFKNLSMYDNQHKETKSSYKRVQRDSVMVRVPVEEVIIETKALEKKAEEAAEFIIKLKKRQFKLLAGVADDYPDGKGLLNDKFPDSESIKYMNNELNALLDEYLSLFLGKTITDTETYHYRFVPENSNKGTPSILFYFSEEKGISESSDAKAKAVIIAFNEIEINKPVEEFYYKQSTLKKPASTKTGLFYRLPDDVIVKIIYNDKTVIDKQMIIAQYGSILTLPSGILKNNTSIEFYPEYGSIKRITEKR